jgi:hypothetical protein
LNRESEFISAITLEHYNDNQGRYLVVGVYAVRLFRWPEGPAEFWRHP